MHANRMVVTALLLLGCSSDRKANRESSSRDSGARATVGGPVAESRPRAVCSYITEAEASDALDQPMRFRPGAGVGQHCTLDPASGDVFHGISADFRVVRGSTGLYDFLVAQKAAEPVGRLGDKAVWLPAGGSRGNLAAVKGGDAVAVSITDLSGKGDLKDRAWALAKRILEHF